MPNVLSSDLVQPKTSSFSIQEGEQYYDEDNTIPEQHYYQDYDSEIYESHDPVLEVATAVNITGDVETDGCNATGGN